jgi:hypothetical protein
LAKIEAMSFYVRVLSFITSLHCITQTEEPVKADVISKNGLKGKRRERILSEVIYV